MSGTRDNLMFCFFTEFDRLRLWRSNGVGCAVDVACLLPQHSVKIAVGLSRPFQQRKSNPRRSRRFALKKPCSRKGGVLPLALCYQHPHLSGPFPTCFIRGAGKYGRSASCFKDERTPVSECGFINTNHTRRAGNRQNFILPEFGMINEE